MPEAPPIEPFYLIVADNHLRILSVEGPMTDDQPWQSAARHARNRQQRQVVCGPTGPYRDALAAECQRVHKLAGVPPGSIVRPRQ